MNRIGWWLAALTSRLLEPDERNAVHGDLFESGEDGAEALHDMFGLVIRRQLALWKSWQPWLALLGVAGTSAVVLSEILFRLRVAANLQLDTYLRYGVHYETGVTARQDIESLFCLAVALFVWSWVGGFVLAALSRRSLWITAALFYLVAFDSFRARLILEGSLVVKPGAPLPLIALGWLLPLNPANLMFLFALVWGACTGLRERVLGLRQAGTWAVFVVVLTALVMWTGGWYETAHEAWSGGLWHGVPWPTRLFPLLLVSWPVGYMLATSWRRRNEIGLPFGGIKR
ncbi:MAG TPA: hypothetical protein VG168_07160 [Bryobacteraceae bacterium]|nr:hypothetical protein [Bryobacteraceae bacterium]